MSCLPSFTVSAPPSGSEQNMTPEVMKAIHALRQAGGGSLLFEQGDYHFYEEGTETKYYAVSNNAAGNKQIVFPLEEMENVTVDGNGARFVIHGKIFPFASDQCKNITLKNIRFDRNCHTHIKLRIRDITEQGFGLEIDRDLYPFRVRNGSLMFRREWGEYSGIDRLFSLHSSDRIRVRYLFTGDCKASPKGLPTPFMWADAEETEWGVQLTYRSVEDACPCLYEEGENLCLFLDGGRENDLLFFNECEDVRIENITIRQAMGMGVIAQLCRNITVNGLRCDYDEKAAGVCVTADTMHFVNCDGALTISDCHITHSEDDILNVHGMYTLLHSAMENELHLRIMHKEQFGFCPYRAGDRLTLIDQDTMEILGAFLVSEYSFANGETDQILLGGSFAYGFEQVLAASSVLVENPDRMPDLHLHHNYFYHFPHLRISGGGDLLIEENHIERGRAAALLLDLSKYWYESGRIRNLIFRRNRMIDCNALGAEKGFIQIGVSGFENATAPKIHETIEISDNEFYGISNYAIRAGGVKNLIIKNNRTDSPVGLPLQIDGIDL